MYEYTYKSVLEMRQSSMCFSWRTCEIVIVVLRGLSNRTNEFHALIRTISHPVTFSTSKSGLMHQKCANSAIWPFTDITYYMIMAFVYEHILSKEHLNHENGTSTFEYNEMKKERKNCINRNLPSKEWFISTRENNKANRQTNSMKQNE